MIPPFENLNLENMMDILLKLVGRLSINIGGIGGEDGVHTTSFRVGFLSGWVSGVFSAVAMAFAFMQLPCHDSWSPVAYLAPFMSFQCAVPCVCNEDNDSVDDGDNVQAPTAVNEEGQPPAAEQPQPASSSLPFHFHNPCVSGPDDDGSNVQDSGNVQASADGGSNNDVDGETRNGNNDEDEASADSKHVVIYRGVSRRSTKLTSRQRLIRKWIREAQLRRRTRSLGGTRRRY